MNLGLRMMAAITASFFTYAAAQAGEPVAAIASPDGGLRVIVGIDGDGRVDYSVIRQGRAVIAPSRLGLLLSDQPKMDRGLEAAGHDSASHDTTWEQPWGEWRFIRNRYNELRVHLVERGGLKRKLDLTFRVFDDGVGFRYEFPDQPALRQVNIADELTEFAVAEEATAWWIVGGEWNRYEQLYQKTRLDQVSQAHTPLTVKTKSGLYIAFHEAALVDYAGMWLRRVDGQRLKAVLAPAAQGPKVRREAPFATPWRTMIIADSAPGLYMSHIELNLNEPNKLGDVSWFKPYKYIGIWWAMHLDRWSWGSGPKHGATTEHAKAYIDFAAENGFKGVLIEGWNQGWDGAWFADGGDFSFTKAYPDFDIEGLAAHAKSKGVKIVGHHETGGNIAHYQPQLADALDLYARLGYDSVKTGYVADAGGVRADSGFEWHDGQVMSRHHLHVVTEAAKRRIAVNDHEPIKDTGLRRTYPNWVSREGARGQEYNAWGNPPNPPDHEPNLIFTRMLAGPFDFTPGVLSLTGRGGQKIQNTEARQLALYVVLYSPIQMAADLPENYAQYPRSFQFIKDVPADWSDTRVLAGEIGDYAVIARKDRNSEDWYLGAVAGYEPKRIDVTLDFLEPGRAYEAQIYRDGDKADWKTDPHDIVIETKQVKAGQSLSYAIVPGGGAAIRFKAL